ncbi:hypothetical protein AAG570_002559 [Ranatra chinensis]|uniref:Uncharacterized protein n=1 Tax=Ranatra chinensis TaxID=642074 RepID=A0ABD0YWB8_9HEMI
MNTTGWEEYWHKRSYGYEAGHETFNHVEERLSYFREDVGLNDFLSQFTVFYPRWLDQHKYPKIKYFRRGELFYYVLQQLLARYSLERYVNYMPKADVLYWDQPITVGYNARVLSPSGYELYPRAYNMVPRTFNPSGVWKAETYEWKIHNDIDSGVIFYYVTGPMGYSFTAGRDPAFYMLINRIMHIFEHHKDALPAYTKKDFYFPGVKVESFEVGKLTTYFDRFDIEATYGVPIPADKSYKDYHYYGMQSRLNHKPFTYKLTVSSDRPVSAIVRTFIGPKYDSEDHPLTFDEARSAFVEFDRFPVKLVNGENVIERNSKESTGYVQDKEGFGSLYKRVESSITTQESFYYTESFDCGFPERLMIPKGSPEGRPLVFYTFVTPYENKFTTPAEERQFEGQIFCGGSKYYDGRPYGFPFDRRVEYEDVFNVPNFYREDVLVYHKQEAEINRSA